MTATATRNRRRSDTLVYVADALAEMVTVTVPAADTLDAIDEVRALLALGQANGIADVVNPTLALLDQLRTLTVQVGADGLLAHARLLEHVLGQLHQHVDALLDSAT